MKKLVGLIAFIVCAFITFIIAYYSEHNYEIEYNVDKIKVIEKYDKRKNAYFFSFVLGTKKYDYSVYKKYSPRRNLIEKILWKERNDMDCLFVTSKQIDDFSFCSDQQLYTTSFYKKEVNNKVTDSYKNIDIYTLKNSTYFIWNYNDFIVINPLKTKTIKLFNNDVYQLELITPIKDYLLVADYDQDYSFEKMFLISANNFKVKTIKLDKKVYFNSYILGTVDEKVYMYDIQKEREYKIDPFKATIEKINYQLFINDEWSKTSAKKLNKKSLFFSKNDSFIINDNKLYYQTPGNNILVTDYDVKKIIYSSNTEAYFISGDSLYFVNLFNGIEKILSYSEWKFNYSNIYVFNNI